MGHAGRCARWFVCAGPGVPLTAPAHRAGGKLGPLGARGPGRPSTRLQSQTNHSRAQSCPRRFLAIALSCSGWFPAAEAAEERVEQRRGEGGRWLWGGRSSVGLWWGLGGEGRRDSTGSATRRPVTRGPERGLGGAGGYSPCRRTQPTDKP